jgi:hypothetical protein
LEPVDLAVVAALAQDQAAVTVAPVVPAVAAVLAAVAAEAVVLAAAPVAEAVVAVNNIKRRTTMKTLYIALSMIVLLSLTMVSFAQGPGGGAGTGGGPSLDAAEEVHLLFMRAEEKLAHDVYVTLGAQFPDYAVFSNIVDSETTHVDTMIKMIEKFGLEDLNSADGLGEFSDNFGDHFKAEYITLTDVAAADDPLLQALKNGALIEELDMHDIVYCPEEIILTVDAIESELGCGMEYTDAKALIRSYGNLLDGSENHLRAFVRVIEATFPEAYPDGYTAQYLLQAEVDDILGR